MSEPGTELPRTCLPTWGTAELPKPTPLRWRNWRAFLGPGIVMMGIQIGAGEWLFGPEITAKYGGGLMWMATIAIVLQVFYNMECGRYALYCGEPIMTGFLRSRPGPRFWVALFLLLSLGAIIPGIAFHAASVIEALRLGRPPTDAERGEVLFIGYFVLVIVVVPVLFGGKIYNTLQVIMSAKVVAVLGFCFLIALFFVSGENWWNVLSGFFKFGTVPSGDAPEGAKVVNTFTFLATHGRLPRIDLNDIALVAAFAGMAGGGGLGNMMYSNYVRDKGWGMGSTVGAIPSAIGGKNVKLSHLGKVFTINKENLTRWKGWWKYIVTDQAFIWAPGCFVGMALPALISIQFASSSELFHEENRFDWAMASMSADGVRASMSQTTPGVGEVLWVITLLVGLMVLLPSQMSVVEDVSRRWTDVIWSANAKVRERMKPNQVKKIYYIILAIYFLWCLISLTLFGNYGTPKAMILVIANLGNLGIGLTAFVILGINRRFLPEPLRPRWYQQVGIASCGVFYCGLALLVFFHKQIPIIRELLE